MNTNMATKRTIASTPRATPTPIPALTPVLIPEELVDASDGGIADSVEVADVTDSENVEGELGGGVIGVVV